MSDIENMSAEETLKLAKKKAAQEKKQAEQAESEENYQRRKWDGFVKAEQVMKATDMKFFRDGSPRYFKSLTTMLTDKKTGVNTYNTEIKFYPPSSLRENWIELDDDIARKMFRTMVEGGDITVQDPETGSWITTNYEPKVFDKITNTLKKVDEKTFNMLRLDDKLTPNYSETDVPKISPYMRALISAICGNNLEWNDSIQDWVGDKEENRVWFEKWIYGTVHADIGNSTTSLPVIFGPGKVGKNALFDIVFKQILGKEACFSSTWDVLHGNFDGFKLNKVVMFIDEVPARDDWSTFKNMTGSPDSFVKQKYGPEFTIENTIRYAIGCNEETYPLPVEDGAQMMRVSPMKTQRTSTFATNFVKIMNKEAGDENYCRTVLAEVDPTLEVDNLDDFTVGDLLLRDAFFSFWASREAAQEFLNYLDYTYKSENGFYNLPPLRGDDWSEIVDEKQSTVNKVANYVFEERVETITVQELYEIYRLLQDERSEVKTRLNGFGSKIKPLLLNGGTYKFHRSATIKGGARVGVYTRLPTIDFSDYEMDISRYIAEQQLSTDGQPWVKKKPMLKYSTDKKLKMVNKITNFNRLIHPEKD